MYVLYIHIIHTHIHTYYYTHFINEKTEVEEFKTCPRTYNNKRQSWGHIISSLALVSVH